MSTPYTLLWSMVDFTFICHVLCVLAGSSVEAGAGDQLPGVGSESAAGREDAARDVDTASAGQCRQVSDVSGTWPCTWP